MSIRPVFPPFRWACAVPVAVRRVLFALALGTVAFISLWPHEQLEEHVSEGIRNRAYLVHAVCYAGLSALALWAFGRRSRPWRSRWAALGFCFLFGALMEALQTLPAIGRSASLDDVLHNLLGAVIGSFLALPAVWP